MTNYAFDEKNDRSNPRRETVARRAFFIWMAAYAAVVVAILTIHSVGGMAGGTVINADGIRTQQAKMTGEPQSSIARQFLPAISLVDVSG